MAIHLPLLRGNRFFLNCIHKMLTFHQVQPSLLCFSSILSNKNNKYDTSSFHQTLKTDLFKLSCLKLLFILKLMGSSTPGLHLNKYTGNLNRKQHMFIGRIYRDLFNQVYYLQLRSLSHTLLLYTATLFPNQFKIYSPTVHSTHKTALHRKMKYFIIEQ